MAVSPLDMTRRTQHSVDLVGLSSTRPLIGCFAYPITDCVCGCRVRSAVACFDCLLRQPNPPQPISRLQRCNVSVMMTATMTMIMPTQCAGRPG
jgi:hypothetical protein